MTGRNAKVLCAAGVVVGVMLQPMVLDARAAETQRSRNPPARAELVVYAEQEMRDVQIDLRVIERDTNRRLSNHPRNLDELRIGDLVEVCFQVSQPGYVTLFSQDGDERPSQIYPNQYEGGDGRVDASEQCLGRRGSGWAFQVAGPPGESLLFMHYARERANQISESDFPVIRRETSTTRSARTYASSTVGFLIVP